VFELVTWVGMDGERDEAPAEEATPAAEAAPARRRRG
jgi:hypothetical protein